MSRNDLLRFSQKYEVRESGCWQWTSSVNAQGYGLFWLNGKSVRAHRLSFEFTNGRVPKDRIVCHRCNNKGCVNHEHLYAGTHSDNTNDTWKAGRKPHNKPMPKGSSHSSSKLKEREVVAIFLSNDTNRAAARKYGVSSGVVSAIRTRRTWKETTRDLGDKQ